MRRMIADGAAVFVRHQRWPNHVDHVLMAQLIERAIGGDMEEPGARLIITAHFGKLIPGAQEDLLGQVAGGLFVASDAPEIAEDTLRMLVIERLELIGEAANGSW